MRYTLFERLALSAAVNAQVTHQVILRGFHTIQLQMVVMAIQGETSPSVSWYYEVSNDGETWFAPSQFPASIVGVGSAMSVAYASRSAARLRFTVYLSTTATDAVLSAKVNLSNG
jgi:pyridoxal/pyridoxine/pyridoxamine kinase